MYVLGIDGGGTKTAIVLLNQKGELIGTATSGPSSIDTVSNEITKNNIEQAIQMVVEEKNIKDLSICSVFAGIGGIASKDHEERVENIIRQIKYVQPNSIVVAKNDVYNALAGGLATKCGIAIIIGTGAVAFGMDEDGKTWRCGGYHYKEGDAGSAYDLGFQALKAMARAMDGRYKKTAFTDEVQNMVGASTFSEAVQVYETYFTDRTKTAQLARLVTKHADLNNEYALKIVDQATNELTMLIKGVDDNLNLKNKEVAIIGGLGNADTIYKKMFIEKVKQINQNYNIHQFLLDPVIGAVLMALKNLGVTITDEMISSLKF